MTLVLQPQNYFTVVHQIPNHTDSATYYIQAVIRNAFTDAVIATLQLTDKGGQRFKKDWQVPADPSGEGFYISIVTSVYSDSGYTTKSENYGDDENTYLIQERIRLNGLGGSSGIDGYDVRRIFKEEIQAMREAELKNTPETQPEIPESEPETPEPMRWDEVLFAISALQLQLLKAESKEPDYSPILGRIEDAITAVNDKEVTPETDLAPVLDRLDGHGTSREVNHSETKQLIEDVLLAMKTMIPPAITEAVKNLHFQSAITTTVTEDKKKVEKPPVDLTKLFSPQS